jgi:hypothetical protein
MSITLSDRPPVAQLDFPRPLRGCDGSDHLVDRVLALLHDPLDAAGDVRRQHDPVLDDFRFLYGPENGPGPEFDAGFDRRPEMPFLFPIQGRHMDSPLYVLIRRVANDLQPSLNAVEDRPQQAGAQFHRKGHSRAPNLLSGPKPRCVLVHLRRGPVFLQTNDLANEPVGTDFDHLRHLGPLGPRDLDNGADHSLDFP